MCAGMKRPGLASSFSRKMPSLVILALMLRSALQETPMPTGQLAPWRGRRMTRTSSAKYLPPNCAPMPLCCASSRTFRLRVQVAERPAVLVAAGRQRVEVSGRGELDRLQAGLGAGAADDEDEVVGRAGRGAEELHLVGDERLEALRVEQRLGLLEEIGLVGRAAALGDEEELVFRALGGVDVDLRGQVGAGVDLPLHVERRRSASSGGFPWCSTRRRRGRATRRRWPRSRPAGPSWPTMVAVPVSWHIGRMPSRGDLGVAEQGERHVAVVGAGLRDRRGWPRPAGGVSAQQKRAVAEGVSARGTRGLGLDLEDFAALEGRGAHALLGEQAVFGFIGAQRQRFLIVKGRCRHGGDAR